MDFSLFVIPAKAGIHPPTTVIPAQAGIQSYHPLAARPSRRHSRAGGNPPTNHRHSRAGGNPATRCNCLDPRIRGDDENLLGIGVKTDHFRLPGREVVIPAQAGIHHQPPSFPRRRESTNHRHSRAGGNPGSCSGSCASALSSFASTASASLRARPSGRTAHRRARAVFGFAQGTAFRPGFPPARE